MSKRELWEIVRADELKTGDAIKESARDWNMTVTQIDVEDRCVCVDGGPPFRFKTTVFRRVSDADDPRVLRRALEIAHGEIESINGNKYFPRETDPIGSYLDQARHELESEGSFQK